MKTITITRKQLYDLVWAEPMRRLATRYGVSDVALAKTCRKHDIPRPPRGYWAKKAAGQTPRQTKLPNPGDDSKITLRDPEELRLSSSALRQAVQQRTAEEEKREAKIEVAVSLRGAHALVSQANQELQAAETDDNRLILPSDKSPLHIRVSKPSFRRALLIMDALLKALEQRGYEVTAGPTVQILDAHVHFEITEAVAAQREQPEDHDLNGRYEFGHSRYRVKRIPSGRLVLQITHRDMYWLRNCRKSWSDGKKQRIEDRLNQFVAGLIAFAACVREREEEEEREARERREEERREKEKAERRAEKRRLIQVEQKRVDLLMQQAQCWRASRTLRKYIEARKKQYVAAHGDITPESDLARWLDWARQQADRLDPLAKSPPSILDEPMPEEPKPRYW